MTQQVNIARIAQALRAEREGHLEATGGYFGALGLVAEVQARFRTPAKGGRPTDPKWTKRRLIPLRPETLIRLQQLAEDLTARTGIRLSPLQVAALVLEEVTENLTQARTEQLAEALKQG
jgi:hypothetical protein